MKEGTPKVYNYSKDLKNKWMSYWVHRNMMISRQWIIPSIRLC